MLSSKLRKLPLIFIVGLLVIVHCNAFHLVNNNRAIHRKSFKSYDLLMTDETKSKDAFSGFAGGLGVAGSLVCGYTLYVLKTTGCNVIPKDNIEGLLLEQGASAAAVISVFIWSVVTKVKTGSGLAAGPGGMLGAAEGLSFLTVLGALVVAILNFVEFGALTSPTACEGLEFTKALGFI